MINATLNQAVISELLNHIRKGEIGYCTQLGFDETELADIAALSTREIQDICESATSFASININHNALWKLIELARANTLERNMIDRALHLGASSEMLHKRFGCSSAEVSARRKLLGIQESMGRKKNASEDEELKVWDLWKTHSASFEYDVETTKEGLELLMFIAEESQVSLTEVARLVSQWNKEAR